MSDLINSSKNSIALNSNEFMKFLDVFFFNSKSRDNVIFNLGSVMYDLKNMKSASEFELQYIFRNVFLSLTKITEITIYDLLKRLQGSYSDSFPISQDSLEEIRNYGFIQNTFYKNILLCEKFKVLGDDTIYQELKYMSKIRNEFAAHISHTQREDDYIWTKDLCKNSFSVFYKVIEILFTSYPKYDVSSKDIDISVIQNFPVIDV